MLKTDVEYILNRIECKHWGLELGDNRGFHRSPWFLRVRGWIPDPRTGVLEPFVGRKWLVSRFSSATEIVRIAFDAIRQAEEEWTCDAFLYSGVAVYGRSVDVDILASHADPAESEGMSVGHDQTSAA